MPTDLLSSKRPTTRSKLTTALATLLESTHSLISAITSTNNSSDTSHQEIRELTLSNWLRDPNPTPLTGETTTLSLVLKIKDLADHAGLSPPLELLRECTLLPPEISYPTLSNNWLIALLASNTSVTDVTEDPW